jgi:hypothetical protein
VKVMRYGHSHGIGSSLKILKKSQKSEIVFRASVPVDYDD